MPQRISWDETALPRSWQPEAIMPGSFDDDWILPVKVRRPPTPWAMITPWATLEPLSEEDEEDEDSHHNRRHTPTADASTWTLPASPLGRFANIHVTLDDIKGHAAHPHPHPHPRASMRSLSASSTTSLDSISTLLSDLDESIASWQSGGGRSDASSSTASARSLRRRRTPRVHSLRDVRAKQSEMQLQRAYEDSMRSYLDDSIYDVFTPPPLRPRNPARLSARYSL